jgi:predicted lipid-binding transport protein (Tim44 family)
MKTALVPFAALVIAASASAQTSIFRCPGNVYTNSQAEAQAKSCKLVEGGNVTVVSGTKVNGAAAASSGVKAVNAPASGPKVDAGEQKARDSEARAILEAELKKAEARYADLQKEFNSGEPEKLGPETRNHQKYLDRVAELKAAIERTEKDIAGLKRELVRSTTAAK